MPMHAPATQEKGQAEITHAPDGLHGWTDVPTHTVVPGVQTSGPASGLKSTVMAAVGAVFMTRVMAGLDPGSSVTVTESLSQRGTELDVTLLHA
jgi:hypothetical protein